MVYFTFSVEQFPRQVMCILCLVNPIAGFTQLTLLFLEQGVTIDGALDRRDLSIYCIIMSAILYFLLYHFMERETSNHSTKRRVSHFPSMSSVTIQLRESLDSSFQTSLNNQSHTLNPYLLRRIQKLTSPSLQASSPQVSS